MSYRICAKCNMFCGDHSKEIPMNVRYEFFNKEMRGLYSMLHPKEKPTWRTLKSFWLCDNCVEEIKKGMNKNGKSKSL